MRSRNKPWLHVEADHEKSDWSITLRPHLSAAQIPLIQLPLFYTEQSHTTLAQHAFGQESQYAVAESALGSRRQGPKSAAETVGRGPVAHREGRRQTRGTSGHIAVQWPQGRSELQEAPEARAQVGLRREAPDGSRRRGSDEG